MIRTLQRGRMGDATSVLISGGISAGVSLATTGLSLWMNSIQLSHDADTATTLIVNGLATQLGNLLNAYQAEPNVTCADQRAALDAYDQAWQWLQSPQACGNPSYGSAGNRCISDRAPGGEYPWQQYYRDPIANDPRLAGQSCDTAQEVLLPSLQTGTYQTVGLTATAGSDVTGLSPAAAASSQIAASAIASASAVPATGAVVTASVSPNLILYGGLALLAILLFSGGNGK